MTQVPSLLLCLADPGRLARKPAGWLLALSRLTSAVIFVIFGAGKFVNHASEASSFRGYGLPAPDVFTDAIGALELVGGGLLLVGLGTRLMALLLAGDMIGAIVTSGVMHNETVSLTLAPALLIVMVALILLGPGQASIDGRRPRGSVDSQIGGARSDP